MTFADGWMRALLRLYPGAFRRQFGHDMRTAFADAFGARATLRGRVALLARSLPDAAQSATGEWFDVLRNLRPFRLMISDLLFALKHAVRALVRNPGFAIATILTLTVGIGATTAVFSVMNTALFTALPYPNAGRLVAIAQTKRGDEISISYPDLGDFQTRARSFESIAGFSGRTFTLTGGAEPERVRGEVVSANLFATLGVKPILGRDFTAADDQPGSAPLVAISYTLWTLRLAGDSGIVGRAIVLDGLPFTIVAVMPPAFRFPDGMVYGSADAWTPMSQLGAGDRGNRDNHPGIVGIGLLRPGATLKQGSAELMGISSALAKEYPTTNREIGVVVRDAIDAIVGSIKGAIVLLFGSAAVVLMIACANVAGLLLTRADSRRRELAIKVALGADGLRVAGNLAGEAIILAAAGGVGGVLLAIGLVRRFGFALADLPRLETLGIDARALAFAVVITVVVAIACSLAPALWARSAGIDATMKMRGGSDGLGSRVRNAFVVGQVALSLVLLSTATLLLRTFERMSTANGGIHADGVVTFTVQLPDSRYQSTASRVAFADALTTRLSAQPGIQTAAAISLLPFSGSGAQSGIRSEGGLPNDDLRTDVAAVTPDYFTTMGIDVIHGRTFTPADKGDGIPVAVVDERFAATMWPNEDAVGKRVGGWGRPEWTIVGVVRHVKNYGVSADSRAEMYVPYTQRPTSRVWGVVRTHADAAAVIAAARAVVKELDPALPLFNARAMAEVVDATVAGPRIAAFLSAGYALTALLVVIIGVHGAVAYLVQRRRREIGVRVALGATAPIVLRLVVRHSVRLTGLGVLIGLGGAVLVARVIREQLFGVSSFDLPTFAIAGMAMMFVGVAASALPTWRALRVSPLVALEDE